MSVYHKEDPNFLLQAVTSIWDSQTLKPNEIVLVKDGPLTPELDLKINDLKEKLIDKLILVELPENVGLGRALNIGLENCRYEIVARMDTDDIAHKDRFEKQLKFLELNQDISLLGSYISEFELSPDNLVSQKKVPLTHDKILNFSKTRNPFNHPSVMYRKVDVINAGSYQDCYGMEDYYLWVRLLVNGVKTANLDESLVSMRAGMEMLSRRKGFRYAIQEFKFQLLLLNLKHITKAKAIINLLLRVPPRLLPSSFLKVVYKIMRRG